MSRCRVCRGRVARDVQACKECGEPVSAIDNCGSGQPTSAPAAVPAAAQQGRRRRRRLWVGGVVLALIVATTTAYLTNRGDMRKPEDAAYGVVQLSSDPGPRWQVELAAVSPVLGCPSRPRSLDLRVDLCAVTSSAASGDIVVASVQREQRAELVGLSTVDGAVRWHRSAPAGSTYDCHFVKKRLWCTTTALGYSVVVSDPGYPQLPDVIMQRSARFAASSLTEFEPRTGAVLHTVTIPRSGGGAQLAGIGADSLYIVVGTADPENTRFRILRYSAGGGAKAWEREVVGVDGALNPPGFNRHRIPLPQVFEVAGKAYVTSAEVSGSQAVFDIKSGKRSGGGAGHVVTVASDTVITQRGTGGLDVGGTGIADQVVAGLVADDRSAGEPILTSRAQQSTDGPVDGSMTAPSYSIRSATDPGESRGSTKPEEIPLAYCDGVVVATSRRGTSGYDPRTGLRIWGIPLSGNPGLQAWCGGSKLIAADGLKYTAYDVHNGRRSWSVTGPEGVNVIGLGLGVLGNPGTGLLFGPQSVSEVGVGTMLTYVR